MLKSALWVLVIALILVGGGAAAYKFALAPEDNCTNDLSATCGQPSCALEATDCDACPSCPAPAKEEAPCCSKEKPEATPAPAAAESK